MQTQSHKKLSSFTIKNDEEVKLSREQSQNSGRKKQNGREKQHNLDKQISLILQFYDMFNHMKDNTEMYT